MKQKLIPQFQVGILEGNCMSFSSLTLCRAVEGMVKEALNPSHPLPPPPHKKRFRRAERLTLQCRNYCNYYSSLKLI